MLKNHAAASFNRPGIVGCNSSSWNGALWVDILALAEATGLVPVVKQRQVYYTGTESGTDAGQPPPHGPAPKTSFSFSLIGTT